jgi:hypothetical protein
MSDHPILFADPKITRQEGYVECGIDVMKLVQANPTNIRHVGHSQLLMGIT